MKPIAEFLSELGNLDIKLWVESNPNSSPGVKLRCNAPSGTLTPEIRASLSDRKTEIISFLQQLNAEVEGKSITPVPRNEGNLPLSPAQQRLWFLDQMEGGSATYNVPGVVEMNGVVDIPALEKSLQTIIQRHEVLRTSFEKIAGQGIQVIHDQVNFRLPIVDVQGYDLEQIRQLLIIDAQKPFDLSQAPLIRGSLFKQSEKSHFLLLNMHHIVSDAWSIGVLIQELSSLYTAFLQGKSDPLPDLPIQYADFAVWQKQWLQGEVFAQKINYWQQQLADAPPLLELPTDRPRPAIQTFTGSSQDISISLELTEKLNSLSQKLGVTLFMTLKAAFVTLLHRYSGQTDILIGSPIANRELPEISGLIGFFVNTLVLRTNLENNPPFTELLQQVKQVALDAYAHQEVPFEQIVDTLQLKRNLSHTPLFQVMFALQNAPMGNLQLPNLELSELPMDAITSKFDLTLSMTETPQGLIGNWEYNTDLFDGQTITRMAGHFHNLLTAIVENPEQTIQELPLLSKQEKQQLLVDWNPKSEYPVSQCLHQQFAQQVQKTPNAIAVSFIDQHLTYQQLNERVNKLAHYLQTLGVSPDVLVGICVERSLDMIIGLLAILKAGGAYVPLDPNYPPERLSFMLDDSQVSILLTQTKWLETLPTNNAKIVCVDHCPEIENQSLENPDTGVVPENLAYIIYTSGSTGKPKGVLVNHCHVMRLFTATQPWFNFDAKDVWTLFHSYAFDFSVWELWGALLHGGRLVVVPFDVSRDPKQFYQLLDQEGVTVLNQTPSAFKQLIWAEAEQGIANLSLRWVIFGGEALDPTSLLPWFERHGDQKPQLVNMYGITETTVHVTFRTLTRTDAQSRSSIIGVPIPDLRLYILDQHLQPVPVGVPGEMYVGGAGVTRGYLRRPELTEQRFISSQFGQRLYKTGDLARYLRDSNIEYLGRIDDQVKVRGFRIELGEIEAKLLTHPQIRETVVLVQEDTPGNKRLVAYFVPTGEVPSSGELREYLKQQLPDYMIPAVFISLDTFPLTANGKLDRRMLPQPEVRPELGAGFVAPQTKEQELLADIWAEVLGLSQVGIEDNFFELGGDSIRSIQIVAQANQVGLDFSLQQLFQHQTIAELAALLEREVSFAVTTETSPFSLITQIDRDQLSAELTDAYPLTALQAGMVFHSELNTETAVYHDVFSFHLRAKFDQVALKDAIAKVIARHDVLRTSFDLNRFSQPLQLVHQTVDVPLQIDDISDVSTEQQQEIIDTWIEGEKYRSFDWTKPPLLRFYVHRRSQETFNLSFSFHHAILDGWSVASLLTELWQEYLNLAQPSSALKLAFRDFVALERAALQSQETQAYWQQQLSEVTVTELPRWPESYHQDVKADISIQEVEISTDLSEGLKKLARTAGVPVKSVLLAAHLRVLNLLSNQKDVLTGLVANGRPEDADGERILGLFLNTLPLRSQLEGGSWLELIQQTFQIEQAALPHRRYPLPEIQRLSGGQPLFETAFNFVHFHIYEGILNLEASEVIDYKTFEQTNFTLVAHFSLDLVSANINLVLNYQTSELCKPQVEAIATYYLNALTAMVAAPSAPYQNQILLSAPEQKQLLQDWNSIEAEYPVNQCLHEWFEAQVEKTPDAKAVVFADSSLTYRELNIRANQLAHHLQTLGVKPDVLVGLCVERGLEMVIGILGILKAGGAYVPLDPDYPSDRLEFMLSDAQIPILVTQSQWLDSLDVTDIQTVCLDQDWPSIQQQSSENPLSTATPENLAYVIYTSGSTGKPKGVLVNHSNVVRLFLATDHWYNFNANDAWTMFHSYAFDFSVWELWGALLYGGKLVVVPYWVSRDPKAFYNLLSQEQVTVLNQTPSAFRQLIWVDKLLEGVELNLRWVIFGGEALEPASLQPWFEKHGDRTPQLINMYGITETTVHVTYRPITWADTESRSSVIGRAIPDLQLYILNDQLQPVPTGVSGEMYVGGAGVTRGYLNRPELTAERFITHLSQRLYKTGDLARYLPDGGIEYLGRIDHQVKIRGFRIELGEIETAIIQHSQIREAVAIVREDHPGDKRLVAYIVATEQPEDGELREHLKQNLPDYMIPTTFVYLDSFPLTANGKLDRKALPVPTSTQIQTNNFVSPRTETEKAIADLFADLLNLEQVGIYDHFFELGGHSLIATQMISRLREKFQIELPLRTLFTSPRVVELAEVIKTQIKNNLELTIPELAPVPRENLQIPLSWAQQRLWFLEQLDSDSSTYNIPAVVQLTGKLNVKALETALAEIVRRHEILRTGFRFVDGIPVQFGDTDVALGLKITDLQTLNTEEQNLEVQRLTVIAAETPFNLQNAPLLRVELLVVGTESHILLMTMHHIISDGWSLGIFIQELSTLYQAFLVGEPSPLPELPIQYADFALWQQKYLSGEILQTKLDYWKQQLADATPLLELPTDNPRPPVQTFRGDKQDFALSLELTQGIKDLCQQYGVTPFMALEAAFVTLLHRYTGERDILIGTPIANRNRGEIEPLIGFFVNTLVLRTQISGNPSFTELLQQVQQVSLDGYAHQDVPFEQVVEALQPERNLSHTPLFQVMFALQNAPLGNLELPDLNITPLPTKTVTAKFDLMLSMEETPEGFIGTWEYASDLFEAKTIARMTNHFQNILRAIVTEPKQSIGLLPMLSPQEKHQVLVDWNQTLIEDVVNKCIPELFREQVQRTPDAVAVEIGTGKREKLTYTELETRANKLAHHLQTLGVQPEVKVGICIERSLDLVVGLLAILKAGGAYVPLDSNYPQERLAYMLADSQAAVLLTTSKLQEILPEHIAKVVCVDSLKLDHLPSDSPEAGLQLDNLAYIIYTSGSTGKPKGVAMTHRSLVNLLQWQINHSSASASGTTLQFAPVSFDVSFQEIFSTWCAGGRLVLVSEETRRDTKALLALLCEQGVERLFLPFVVLQQLAEVGENVECLPPLLEIITAGEQLQVTPALKHFFQRLGSCKLQNQYGPSETHVVTAYTLGNKVEDWPILPPIGKAITNTQIYILDQYLQPVPTGVKGELYVGGVAVARGYLNRPDLTHKKFISHNGMRLYKTGDLARYLPDGNIEYLGRIDNQVKVRGFRVELGEIEVALNNHPLVQQAIVVVEGESATQKRLIAYIVFTQAKSPTTPELRQFLQQQLPEYLLPSVFVQLDKLPLTANGKVDRRSSLAVYQEKQNITPPTVPSTPAEELLTNIWAEVLGVNTVGVHDNFFYLGGHSLLAAQLANRIQQTFDLELPVREIFQKPTVSEIVPVLAQLAGDREILDEIALTIQEIEQMSPEEMQALLES